MSDQNKFNEMFSNMPQEEFNLRLDAYFAAQRDKEQSDWSDTEGFWDIAVNQGVFDGSKPQSPLMREQAAAILGRLGLLEADAQESG